VPNGGSLRVEPGEIRDYASRILAVIAAAPAAARVFFLEAVGVGQRVRVRRNEAIREFVYAIAPAMCDFAQPHRSRIAAANRPQRSSCRGRRNGAGSGSVLGSWSARRIAELVASLVRPVVSNLHYGTHYGRLSVGCTRILRITK
jgi:hypothetical protein